MNYWKCSNCGYQLTAEIPPDKCPSCEQVCAFIDIGCYIPDCGGEGHIDPRLA